MKNAMNEATALYQRILVEIMTCGNIVRNERTGVEVRECLNKPFSFTVFLPNQFPILQNRKYSPYVAAAETAWQLLGTKRTDFINKYAPKLWSKFEIDGKIANTQGYRWRYHFGVDQITEAIRQIKRHPTDRQIILSSWDPYEDFPGSIAPNKHCLPFLNLRPDAINGMLHATVFSRSADMILGFPYDLYNYSFLLYAFSKSTYMRPGYLSIVLNNYHVYLLEDHIDVASRLISEHSLTSTEILRLPLFSIDDIIQNPDKYVNWVKTNMKVDHTYTPKLEIVV